MGMSQIKVSESNKRTRKKRPVWPRRAAYVAAIAALALYIFRILAGEIPVANRLGFPEIVLVVLVVFLASGFLERVREVAIGDVTVKLHQVAKRQKQQRQQILTVQQTQEQLRAMLEQIQIALGGVVTRYEFEHLRKLVDGVDDTVTFGPHFFSELERLDALGFLKPERPEGLVAIKVGRRDGDMFRLREFVSLTERGEQYLAAVQRAASR